MVAVAGRAGGRTKHGTPGVFEGVAAARHWEAIHVVGGGSQNALLCQFTADACNRQVLADPVEATAIGNVLVQAIRLGLLGSGAVRSGYLAAEAILKGSACKVKLVQPDL